MKVTKLKNKRGYFVEVSDKEALQIIQSLTVQMLNKDPNTDRKEFYTDRSQYFSIAVIPPLAKHTVATLKGEPAAKK